MKLGLGLSIPGIAAQGGNQGERILSTAKHLYDARRGSAFTDYGTGGANGAATDVTHATKWWTFNGSSSVVTLWAPASIALGATDNATIVVAFRRTQGTVNAGIGAILSSKDEIALTAKGFRVVLNTSGAGARPDLQVGDGTLSAAKAGTGFQAINGTVIVGVGTFGTSLVSWHLNGTQIGTTDRSSVGDATASTAAAVTAGRNAVGAEQWYDGDVGLIAAFSRQLTATERAAVTATLRSAFA
jgi:hypothetical protein